MRLKRRKLICIITSFIMAVTVFGCTSLTFAADGDGDNTDADGVRSAPAAEPAADANDTPSVGEGTEGGNDGQGTGGEPGETRESGETGGQTSDPLEYTIDAPRNLQAVGGNKEIKLSWGRVSEKYDGSISYAIYDSAEDTAESIATTTNTSYTVPNLSPKTYTYYVSAIETIGEGEDAVIVESTRAAFSPAKVIDFSSQKLTGLISDPGYMAVLLEWNKVEGADGYLIYRRQGGERGNTDSNCRDSNTSNKYNLMTFKSSKSKGYGIVKKPGAFTYRTTLANNADRNGKISYRDPVPADLNMSYVYFYQYVIVPYRDGTSGREYCLSANGTKITDKTKDSIKFYGTNVNYNVVKNNPVLPMYILYKVKSNKPYYRTHKMSDGKKMGRLSKGTYYIGFDKKDGRDRFYMSKSGTSRKEWWFAQKNAGVVQGYYLNNGNSKNLNRKDWAYGYSKKTVLDYVNHVGVSSKTNYLIWVSKYAQHAYIFQRSNGKWVLPNNSKDGFTTGSTAYWSNFCASGKVLFNSRNNNGPIYGKQYVAKRGKYWYYNLSKLHSTERLHSILYKKRASFSSGKYYDRTLGSPKSNGCIRLRPGASQFIYKKVPTGTKVLVY